MTNNSHLLSLWSPPHYELGGLHCHNGQNTYPFVIRYLFFALWYCISHEIEEIILTDSFQQLLDETWYRPLKPYTALLEYDHLKSGRKILKFLLSWIFLIIAWIFILQALFNLEKIFYNRIIPDNMTVGTNSTNNTIQAKPTTSYMKKIYATDPELQCQSL